MLFVLLTANCTLTRSFEMFIQSMVLQMLPMTDECLHRLSFFSTYRAALHTPVQQSDFIRVYLLGPYFGYLLLYIHTGC